MSLTFLVPLFLLGIAGIVVPIAVHLTRKQRRNVVQFPSLMFLEKIPYQEQRRRRIQNWVLLSLRALALALLALAFARPFVDRTDVGLAGSGGPREVVVLVDRSYSMAAGDRLDQARDEVGRILGQLGPLDRASVVAFDQGADVLVRSTADPSRLRGAVDTLRIGSGSTRYGPALKVAQTILEESNLPRGEIFLLSDFQRIGWTGDEGIRLPRGAKVTPVPLGPVEAVDNIQITGVSLPRQIVAGRERITPVARLVRRGGSAPREISVSLSMDGQEVQQRPVTLPGDGAATVTFQPVTLSRPHTRGTVSIPGDALPADDTHDFVLSPGNALSVLVLGSPGRGEDPTLYLRRALEITEDGHFRVTVRRSTTIQPEDLAAADAVILNDVSIDGASAERLRTFLQEGGGVLLALGENSRWPESARDLLPGTIGSVQDRALGRGGRLGYLEYGHPVFEMFAGPRSGDFTSARFFRARGFQIGDSATVLARFDDGSVALAERRFGRGKLMAWTTTLHTFWNDMALQPVYLPFVQRMAEYLGGRADAVPWFTIGQVVDLADPVALQTAGMVSSEASGLADGADQVVISPSGNSVLMPAGDGPRYLPLREHGFYTVRPPGTEPERPFVIAVNVDLEESNLARIDPEELVLQIGSPVASVATGQEFIEATAMQRNDQEQRQSLWRWLLLIALTLLMAETALSNWASRKGTAASV